MDTIRVLPVNFHSDEYGGVSAPPSWLTLPGYTVLPILRGPIGINHVHPWKVLIRTLGLIFLPALLMAFINAFIPPANRTSTGHDALTLFALAYMVISLVIFSRRWLGQRRGEKMHSAEAGYSWLAQRTTLPVVLCEQVIVPVMVAALGYVVAHTFSFELGWWLVAAGISLFIIARWEYRRVWAQHQSTVDDLIRARAYEERVDRQEAQRANPYQATADAIYADWVRNSASGEPDR